MSTKPRSYAAQLTGAQEMTFALQKHLDTLQKRGMTEEFISKLAASISNMALKNSAQEEAKAILKMATAALDEEVKQVKRHMQEAVKVVKLAMPQEQWVEFGIQAKK